MVLLGDFNAHNILLGDDNTGNKGHRLEDFIHRVNLCLLNNGSYTYKHPATGAKTAIDLTLCDPNLYLDFKWEIKDDVMGSDHYPIFIRSNAPLPDETVPQWKLNKADWVTFKQLCEEEIQPEIFEDSDDPIALFTDYLSDIAERTIPKSSAKPKKKK